MGIYTSLRDHFLIAMPTLADPLFARSVTYICEHTPEGAMGIVVNLPLSIHVSDILENMKIQLKNTRLATTPVLAGGPLQKERGFVIHRPTSQSWQSSLQLNDNVCITTSRDILEALASNEGPSDILVALGYAGWESGQLEKEISQNSWLCGPMEPKIIFDTPLEQRWQAAAALLGIDLNHLSHDIGHA